MMLSSAQRSLALRLLIGLAQGGALWLLHDRSATKLWPATEVETFRALVSVALVVPAIAIAGIDNLRLRTLLVWAAVAAMICAGLGFYAGYREAPPDVSLPSWFFSSFWSSFTPVLAVLFFIGHSLAVAADADRRPVAGFPTYFDVSWRHATQLALAAVFVGLFWLILWLGAEMFRLIRIEFFATVIAKAWFWIPATTVAASAAFHLTDTSVGIVRGTRALVLNLLAWLLPILVLIGAGFLTALPFTGLQPLWATRFATGSLLIATVALILLINAHFQDGGPDTNRNPVLLYARLAAALLIAPLIVLATVGLGLRVEQYGWTPSRIVALAWIVVIACHSVGYLAAALRSATGLVYLPVTNVLSAFVMVAVLIALLTPIADPARLSVASQVARLESGKVTPDKFDFYFLKSGSARYGWEALGRLKDKKDGPNAQQIAEKAAAVAKSPSLWDTLLISPPSATPATRVANIKMMRPDSVVLPAAFLGEDWNRFKGNPQLPGCLTAERRTCEGLLLDLTGDGTPEILLFESGQATVFTKDAQGKWSFVGRINRLSCNAALDAIRSGKFDVVPPAFKDIEANGVRLQVTTDCPPQRR